MNIIKFVSKFVFYTLFAILKYILFIGIILSPFWLPATIVGAIWGQDASQYALMASLSVVLFILIGILTVGKWEEDSYGRRIGWKWEKD